MEFKSRVGHLLQNTYRKKKIKKAAIPPNKLIWFIHIFSVLILAAYNFLGTLTDVLFSS